MSYNKAIIEGRLTRDPDLRTTGSGTSVCDFGVAYDSGWGDKKKACFIDITCWGKQADFVKQFFKKGDGILVDGALDFDTWEDKNSGAKRSKHKITASNVTFPIQNKKKDDDDSSSKKQYEETEEIPF